MYPIKFRTKFSQLQKNNLIKYILAQLRMIQKNVNKNGGRNLRETKL